MSQIEIEIASIGRHLWPLHRQLGWLANTAAASGLTTTPARATQRGTMQARLIKRGTQAASTATKPAKRTKSPSEIRNEWLAAKRLREAAELQQARKTLGRA